MGCNASVSNSSIDQITDEQIQQIKDGTISPLSYQFFLKNFYYVIRHKNFYTELPLEKQIQFFENIGVLTKEECSTVVENFVKFAENDDTLFASLHSISRRMICKTQDDKTKTDIYIPVSLDEKLWKSIMQKKFKAEFGQYKIKKGMINWESPKIIEDREQFISENQNQISYFDHSKDLSLLIQNNPIDNLWKKNINADNELIIKNVSCPFFWEKNIHHAAYKGKISSVEYSLSLIPQLLHLVDEKDNNMVHYAAKGNQNKMLIYLHEIGADFNSKNSVGFLPVHLISNKSAIHTMNSLGIDINVRNDDGESILDINTRVFDKTMIKTLLELGCNILEPNPNGAYWIQTAMYSKYFGNMNEDKFVNFVRKILYNNKTASWNENQFYQEIIVKMQSKQYYSDVDDLNESVKEQNIPRINVLLALGTKPDKMNSEKETNLYFCSKNGIIEIVPILLNNYCDPNFTNNRNENTFWVATINEHFEIASLLVKNGANVNIINSSGETLLHEVYRREISHIFQFVLKSGGSPNIKNRYEETVTFIAFKNKDDEIAEMLQNQYRGDINSQNQNKDSLVHLAIKDNDFDRIEYLCERRININLKNRKGNTALMEAFLRDFSLSKLDFLINHGSDINTYDNDNNTLLHHLFFKDNPQLNVFKFLIDHNIDYDIKNKKGQLPISLAIQKKHDKIGFELLNLNCKIRDKNSIYEPIVEALNRGSSKWFEELVKHGADAMNQKVGVISRYINSGFFNYSVFRRISQMDIFLEAPLQMALYEHLDQCAIDIWNYANSSSTKEKLSYNKDNNYRIPLSVAIIERNERFVNYLLKSNYDCSSSDKLKRTPFIYACISDNISWMVDLFKIISIDNANKVDVYDCSGLTYAASNKRKDFCNALFINNIEIDDIKVDEYGIIKNYRNIIARYKNSKTRAKQNYDKASASFESLKDDYEQVKKRYDNIDDEIIECEKEINRRGNLTSDFDSDVRDYEEYINYHQRLLKEKKYLNRCYPSVQYEFRKAESAYNYYKNRYDEINKATRKDILERISYIERLSEFDKDIGNVNWKEKIDDSDCTIC